jgi:hypothetical protein
VSVQYREGPCRGALNEHVLAHLARDRPAEIERDQRRYRRAYLDTRAAEPIRAEGARLRAHHGIADRRRERLGPAPDPEQLSLAL